MAPEAIFNTMSKPVENLDSWAFGCIVYELLFGKSMFIKAKGMQQLGSLMYLIFQEKFSHLKLPEFVLKNIIENDTILNEAAEDVKKNIESLQECPSLFDLLQFCFEADFCMRIQPH